MGSGDYKRLNAKYEYKNLICKRCGIVFDSITKNKKQKFCSKKCATDSMKNNKGWFRKGVKSWNAGIKGKDSHSYGQEFSQERRSKIGLANSESRNHLWKGDLVKYSSLHSWVNKYLGSPRKCSMCKSSYQKRYEWANVDHSYKRNKEDWIRLCVSCHKKYDKMNGNSGVGKNYREA